MPKLSAWNLNFNIYDTFMQKFLKAVKSLLNDNKILLK